MSAREPALADYATMPLAALQAGIRGRHVLIATHGFNVNRADGIASLANWEDLLQLPSPAAFVGRAVAGRLRLGARA